MDKCIKRICGWTGTDDEKKPVPNIKLSKDGITVNDLTCPQCGCRTFTEVKEKAVKPVGSLRKKQLGYYGFGNDMGKAFMVMFVIAMLIGWGGIELVIWLFSHIDVSWR